MKQTSIIVTCQIIIAVRKLSNRSKIVCISRFYFFGLRCQRKQLQTSPAVQIAISPLSIFLRVFLHYWFALLGRIKVPRYHKRIDWSRFTAWWWRHIVTPCQERDKANTPVVLCHSTTGGWRVDDGVYVFSLEVTVINLSVHQGSNVNVHATRPPTTAIVVDASPSPSQSTVYFLSLYSVPQKVYAF